MTKKKIEKIIVISFIGLIVLFLVGVGGNIILKAGSPEAAAKPDENFENRLQTYEDKLLAGKITLQEYDSLSGILRSQVKQSEALKEEPQTLDHMPEWVVKLGIGEPEGMNLDKDFSTFTSVDDPTEGFNSVSFVYTGTYEQALAEAAKIAQLKKLSANGNFIAVGSPLKQKSVKSAKVVSYTNYSLGNSSQDFLISLQVEPSGKLIIGVTDNKQLNKCLLAYEPLNNRQNSVPKRKKQ
jgi:hypothetical protein